MKRRPLFRHQDRALQMEIQHIWDSLGEAAGEGDDVVFRNIDARALYINGALVIGADGEITMLDPGSTEYSTATLHATRHSAAGADPLYLQQQAGEITDGQHGVRGASLHSDSHIRLHAFDDALDHSGEITNTIHGTRGSYQHDDAHPRQHAIDSTTDHSGSLGAGQHGSLADGDHTDVLTGNARVRCRKNGTTVGVRRAINFNEGANITLTMADDAGAEEVDITIAAAGGGGGSYGYSRHEGLFVLSGELDWASSTSPRAGFLVMPAQMTVEAVEAFIVNSPGGAPVILDLHRVQATDKTANFTGTTIFSSQGNRPQLTTECNYLLCTAPDVTSFDQGDALLLYLEGIGSTYAGKDVTLAIRFQQLAAGS